MTTKEGPNDYMETLVNDVATLHRVLSKHLHESTVGSIMSQVFSNIENGLTEEVDRLNLRTESSKANLLVDVRYLYDKLDKLGGTERFGSSKVDCSCLPSPFRAKDSQADTVGTCQYQKYSGVGIKGSNGNCEICRCTSDR